MKSEYTFAALAKQDVAPGPDADALFSACWHRSCVAARWTHTIR